LLDILFIKLKKAHLLQAPYCHFEETLELSKVGRMAVITTDEHGEVEYSKCQAYSPDWEQVKDHLHKNLAMYLL
jgi:hypothetical protein